jgi:hypothetical protein
VIMTMQFTNANVDFKSYMERQTAVDIQNDYDLRDPNKDSEISTHKAGYEAYVDYMKRDKATEKSEAGLTPTFNAFKDNLSVEDNNELRSKLKNAQEHQNLMWQGVISFRTDFLKDQEIYDPKRGLLDQKSIKAAVRDAMPHFLQKNKFGKNSFWWADIHLNTNHVHVHFAISETGISKRPKHRSGENKGILNQSSMRQLRGNIYNNLQLSEEKNLNIQRLTELTSVREKTASHFKNKNKEKILADTLLNNAYRNLPQLRVKSFKSNKKEFKKSKYFISKYIDQQLATNNDFKKMQLLLQKQDKNYTEIYGISNSNYSKNQIRKMKTQIGNDLLKQMYAIDVTSDAVKASDVDITKQATLDQNKLALDVFKRELAGTTDEATRKKLKYQISLRRIQIRKQNLSDKLDRIHRKQKMVNYIKQQEHDPLIQYWERELTKAEILTELEARPRYTLNKEELGKRAALQLEQLDPAKISVTSRLLTKTKPYRDLNIKTQQLISKTKISDENFKSFYQRSKAQEMFHLKQMLKILDTKEAIHTNNKKMSNTKDFSIKENNAILFKQLTKQLIELNLSEVKSRGTDRNKVPKEILADKNQKILKKNRTASSSFGRGSLTQKTINGLSKFTSANISNRSQAVLKQREDMDRQIEREEEVEKSRS